MNPPLPSPELRARVLEAVQREPVPSRSATKRRHVRAVVIGFAVPLAILALSYFGGPKAHDRPPGYVAALALAWLPIAALATWAGVAQGRSMLGRPATWAISVVALTPAALLATWAVVAAMWPSTLADPSGPPQHVVCNVMTLSFAAGPLIAFGVLRRRSDPLNPRLTGAALGAASAAWAAVVLHILCGFTSAPHILLGHIAPVVLITLIGSVWTSRTVAIRAKTG
jgi:hypothetical protein